MAKPICVVYFNPEALAIGGNMPDIGKMNKMFEDKFPDYHTFAFPSYQSSDGSCEDVRFVVYNADKMDEIELEEFKKQIQETIMEDQVG